MMTTLIVIIITTHKFYTILPTTNFIQFHSSYCFNNCNKTINTTNFTQFYTN